MAFQALSVAVQVFWVLVPVSLQQTQFLFVSVSQLKVLNLRPISFLLGGFYLQLLRSIQSSQLLDFLFEESDAPLGVFEFFSEFPAIFLDCAVFCLHLFFKAENLQ